MTRYNRAQRRAGIASAKHAIRRDGVGEWDEVPLTDEMRAAYNLRGLYRAFRNRLYSVQVYRKDTEWGQVDHLMVRRHDAAPVRSWSDMQAIKNTFGGLESVAVEVYPRDSELVDDANIYHLWVLPASVSLPFGLNRGAR